jgi:ribose transport system substrate-binding protein
MYPKLKGAAVTNPATVGGAGAAVALKLLAGKSVPKNQLLTPQVWTMPGSKAIMKKFYSPKLAPTFSDTLQVPGYTTYTIPQLLKACK